MSLSQKPTIIFVFITSLIFSNLNISSAQTENRNTSDIYTLKSGTRILLKMDNEINSKSSGVNDTFTAEVSKPITVNGTVVLPANVVFEGRILEVKSASSGGKGGLLKVRFETLSFKNGIKRRVDAVLVTKLNNRSSKKSSNAFAIIGGTALGALIGALAKSESGAVIGAGLGAGAGSLFLFRKGKEVRIKAGEEFEIELVKDVRLPTEGF